MKTNYKAPVGKGLYIINTGDWRTFKPVINREKCISCGICLIHCPVNAVKKIGKEMKIDLSYCKGCGICAKECPKKCIDMMAEEVDQDE